MALHCFAPGTQVPAHVPVELVQTKGHAVPMFCHKPLASQSCGCRPLHCFAPGAQVPMHVPVLLLQTKGHAAPAFCHLDAFPQVCG